MTLREIRSNCGNLQSQPPRGSLLNIPGLSRALGRLFRRMFLRYRMKLQEGGCGVAGTSRDLAGVRSLGDAQQQADQQIAPEQPGELLSKFGRTAREQSGRLGLGRNQPSPKHPGGIDESIDLSRDR